MSEQPGPVAFVSLRSTTATGPYNGEKTLNLNCPAKADHLTFGNEEYWILQSLEKVINKFRNVPLDVRIVSYGESNPRLLRFLNELKKKN